MSTEADLIAEVNRRTDAGERVVVIVGDGPPRVATATEVVAAAARTNAGAPAAHNYDMLRVPILDWPEIAALPPTRADRKARRARARLERKGVIVRW